MFRGTPPGPRGGRIMGGAAHPPGGMPGGGPPRIGIGGIPIPGRGGMPIVPGGGYLKGISSPGFIGGGPPGAG